MYLNECPCKDCVAPKRFPGCHASCKEYLEWSAARQQYLEARHAQQHRDNNCFPNRLRKPKKRR